MDRLYLEGPDDAEVDALLSQLNDESLLKLKVNTHKAAASYGFEYPTFTDGWANDEEDLDNQLASRFSSLKLPINSGKKRGKDSSAGGRRGSNSDRAGKKGKDYVVMGKKRRDSHGAGRRGRNLEVVGEEEEENEMEGYPANSTKSTSTIEDGSNDRHQRQKAPTSTSLSQPTELLPTKSSDNLEAAATINREEDLDKVDAQLQERFRALKAPPAPPPPVTTAANRNVGLENLMQFADQQRLSSSNNDYENYGSTLSTPSSPSAKLLGRSTSRSSPSPRVLTSSVSSSCRCSAPSPLKLLKQVSSKTFPSKQQLPAEAPTLIEPLGGSDSISVPPGKEVRKDDHKSKGSGTSKPGGKDNEKSKKERKEKKEHNSNEDNSPSTVKDMKKLLSSVADRVSLERNRVSSAEEEVYLGDDDLHYWSVLDGEEDFARASTEEQDLNHQAEQVVEWAKDAARLEMGNSDLESETEEFNPGVHKDEDEDTSGGSDLSEGSISSKVKNRKKGVKATPKKKKWGLF